MTGSGDGRPGVGSEIGAEIAQLSVWEMVATVVIIAPLLAGISLRIDRLRALVLTWLTRQDVLVRNATLVDLPGGDGLGLDLNRLLVALGLAGLAIWVAAQAIRSRRLRLREAELGTTGRR